MSECKLTAAQIKALEPYERNFKQATEAAWCSYPGQAGINLMLETWTALTGMPYAYRAGCPHCLLNLVRDLGTLYFAQKPAIEAAQAAAKRANASKAGKTTNGKKGAKKDK